MRKVKKSRKHPGFEAVSESIASKLNISQERADAILASKTRGAGKAARKSNPRLNRVPKSKPKRKGK